MILGSFTRNYPIYVSSDSEDDEVDQDPIMQQDGTITNDKSLIYHAADLNQRKTGKDLPPGVLSVPLMRHQKIALKWMSQKERRSNDCLGGILADDQGLGKKISTIALILLQKLKSQSKPQKPRCRRSGGTLVVCPTSVVRQWVKELDHKVSVQHKLSVLEYDGPNRTNDPVELAKYDVVVTTYALVTNIVPQNPYLNSNDGKSEDGAQTRKRLSDAVARVKWLRVVLDEAQTIKDNETQVARACSSLKAKMRWCLSGTLIEEEDKVLDLFSYFEFLRYHPYAEFHSFCQRIRAPITRNHRKGFKNLRRILGAILLRRTKGTILDGRPIIQIPPKTVNMIKVDLSPEERIYYSAIERIAKAEFKAYAASGTVKENLGDILLTLSRLSHACDHPQLVITFKESQRVNEDHREFHLMRKSDFVSTKIKAVMDTLESLGKQDSRNSLPIKTLVSTQWGYMLDLLEHHLVKNGISFRRLHRRMSLLTRDIAEKEFNNDPNVNVMLMNLRDEDVEMNMVSVCQVIVLDLWWNPSKQDQAIDDRVLRIGQTRPVTVTRINITNTVEDRILALQEKKRKVVGSPLGEDYGGLCPFELTIEELKYIICGM